MNDRALIFGLLGDNTHVDFELTEKLHVIEKPLTHN